MHAVLRAFDPPPPSYALRTVAPARAWTHRKPRIVIVGAGFGGLAAAKTLADAPAEVVLIDKRNYHLFQPLLYQVATAALSPADIATPIRAILAGQRNATVLMARVTGIDQEHRQVMLGEQRVPYDFLVLATGARHAYFGKDEWEPFAPGLKKIEDATDIRRRILVAFEKAETEPDPAERRRLMNFVIVGGGPTGVELAGAVAELARHALRRDFRNIDTSMARIVLVQSPPRLLPSFPERLSAEAKRALEKLGVEVRVAQRVTECDAGAIVANGERIETRTVIWAAGVAASQAAKWLKCDKDQKDRNDRVKVGPDLSLPGRPEIFVVGDTALALDEAGNPVPGLAPAAKQMGEYVARLIAGRIAGRPAPGRFRYEHAGNLATIGRKSAVADFGWLHIRGSLAWLLWGGVHVLFLIGFRNRAAVLLDWLWAYVTWQRGSRLITGGPAQ